MPRLNHQECLEITVAVLSAAWLLLGVDNGCQPKLKSFVGYAAECGIRLGWSLLRDAVRQASSVVIESEFALPYKN